MSLHSTVSSSQFRRQEMRHRLDVQLSLIFKVFVFLYCWTAFKNSIYRKVKEQIIKEVKALNKVLSKFSHLNSELQPWKSPRSCWLTMEVPQLVIQICQAPKVLGFDRVKSMALNSCLTLIQRHKLGGPLPTYSEGLCARGIILLACLQEWAAHSWKKRC